MCMKISSEEKNRVKKWYFFENCLFTNIKLFKKFEIWKSRHDGNAYVQKKEKRPLTYGETHPRFIIFHILMEQPSFRNRIIVIKDDCSLWNLDISIIDKATLV
ncbi:fatty acyl-CoA reductase wat-like [Vespula squamosa]|uniref:Fatty acyl-CoA reductase wat-like n=1 Tax=Vespula squamosa TaxID=30214 RepID=A0ABD2BHA9_VESSQ